MRQQLAAVDDEFAQQRELGRGQVKLRAVTRHLAVCEVHFEVVGERDQGALHLDRRETRPAQRRRDPREQLVDAERLRQVVVGAEVEGSDLVVVAAARRDDDDADTGALTDLLAELEPVDRR